MSEYIPPPPQYQATSDIPPESSYHYSPAPQQTNRSAFGWLGSALLAIWAVIKYGGLFLVKLPAFATLATALVSVAAWALAFGSWWAGLAVVVMIFLHEMGHVLEIRRQGMAATAPIFIPFLGAAIFQRAHPTDALKQAQIGIAGPIAGTIAATVAWLLFGSTHNPILLFAAWFGFLINLFNMLPAWQLDGAWILAPVSPWFQVVGIAAIVVGVFFFHILSVLAVIIAVLSISTLAAGFRNAKNPYYTSVPIGAKWALGASWLGLVLYLAVMTFQAEGLLTSLAR
ncbi:MAG TPA: site-2 protease family protein [Candidatus Dormibacteraeota bacterium]|nr:site-2 protease family protein [Candidatus Dormibacteraeota bacterium]